MTDDTQTVSTEPAEVHPVFHGMRRSLSTLATIAVLVTFYFAKDLILPVLLGVLLSLTLSPVTRALRKIGIPHAVSAIVLVAVTAVSILSVTLLSAGTINGWIADAPEIGQTLKYKLSGLFHTIEGVRDASEQVEGIAAAKAPATVQEVVIRQPSLLDSAVSTLTSLATTVSVALILATFLLASGDMFYVKLVQSFKSMSGKKKALTAVYDIERKVSRYLLTITIINAALGLAMAATLFLIGFEYTYIWGTAVFLLNYIPFVGGLVGTILVAAYGIVHFDGLYYALLAPIAYQVLSGIEGQFITPLLVGRSLEMNAVAVFLTVVLWGWLWGIPGALVAVPFLVVFKVICENFEGLKTFGNFLGKSDPRPEPQAQSETEAGSTI